VLRVALVRDFDKPRLFGVRLYAERVRQALHGRCQVVDVYPWPRRAAGPAALRAVQGLHRMTTDHSLMQRPNPRAARSRMWSQSHPNSLTPRP